MGSDLSLSVLDQSPIRQGGTAAQALQETVALAQEVERLGYKRYWVAEHHNTGGYAGTTPEILIGQIASRTSTIRVGSGGVMLSHYSALKVAETFRLLSSFYPGRIDLGIGRAPGSDQLTAKALVYPRQVADINAFPRQVSDLVGFLTKSLPENHPFAGIDAQVGPVPDNLPVVWLLGSSDYSAQLAAMLGLPFAFADFFGNAGDFGPRIAELYRQQFRPSSLFPEPVVSVAVHVICSESADQAHRIAASRRLAVLMMRTGRRSSGLLPPDKAASILAETQLAETIPGLNRHDIAGDPAQVFNQLMAVAERYQTQDLVVATNCYRFEDRVTSYQLVADVLRPAENGSGLGISARPSDEATPRFVSPAAYAGRQ